MKRQPRRIEPGASPAGFLRRLIPAFALAGLTLAVAAQDEPVAETQQHRERSRKLENVQLQIRQLTDDLTSKRESEDKARADLSRIEKRIAQTHGKLRDARTQQDRIERKRQQLIHRREKIESSIEADLGIAANALRSAYASGRQPALRLLLNQEDPSKIARAMGYLSYINRERQRTLDRARSRLDELSNLYAGIERNRDDLAALQTRVENELTRLKSSRSMRKALIKSLQRTISRSTTELSQLRSDEKRLQELLNQLESALADIPKDVEGVPIRKLRGKLNWPTKGYILIHYGHAKQEANLRWSGVMIAAREGSPVHAVAHGRVAFADWLRGQGLLMIIDHGDGVMSLYGHNQSLYKNVGDWVTTGDIIASVGDSGGQKQAALYFEIRDSGKPANPKRWCKPAPRDRVGQLRPPAPAASETPASVNG